MGFIMDFLYGKIEPQERPWEDCLERDKILTALDENERFLQDNLNGEAKDRLKAYIEAWDKTMGGVDDAAFLKGFRVNANHQSLFSRYHGSCAGECIVCR